MRTWLYTGTWTDTAIVMIVEVGDGYNISFCLDGNVSYFKSNLRLETLPVSWELVQ